MLQKLRLTIFFVFYSLANFAQTEKHFEEDSIKTNQLEEVIVISEKDASNGSDKPLSTLDQYLEKAGAINMIRRGSYAWEPFLNGMATERSLVTIDGMRIYGACTDKMDPVTSYIEVSNLSNALVHSGQSGAAGATVAGSLDLVRKKSTFGEKSSFGNVQLGFESNNQQKIAGAALSFIRPKWITDLNFTYRDANNYKAGGGEEILYSPFTKYNLSLVSAYKIAEHKSLEASIIYDKASNVGYPALPMDVLLAKAFIGSIEYVQHQLSPTFLHWQTKLYFNDVTHVMDDTKRPATAIKMDMPGWSKTYGFYSKIQGKRNNNDFNFQLSGHHNKSLAEMTMFANNPSEKDMFMLTWPGVLTNYADMFFEDHLKISKYWDLNMNVGIAAHNNIIVNDFGLSSLKIFYPEMSRSNTRLLRRASANVMYRTTQLKLDLALAYGERAPSVSEGYGFYLFNSFDKFDYIGNPNMKNERSASLQYGISYTLGKVQLKFSGSDFLITNYIIGKPDSSLSVMTIGASGVKKYEQIKQAQILNSSLDLNVFFNDHLTWSNKTSYRFGTGTGIEKLPLMQPFSFNSSIAYRYKKININFWVNGALKQNRYNINFGEKPLPGYICYNLSIANKFKLRRQHLLMKLGIENILDRNYTTFADWNRLPRMGRNVYVNTILNF